MKKTFLALMAAIALFSFTSCEKVVGTGPVVTETRTVNNFTGVSAAFGGQVNIRIGATLKVEVSAQQNILNVLETEVNGGVLNIDYEHGVYVKNSQQVKVDITMPYADYLKLNGSGNMDLLGNNISNNLTLQVSGSGNISVQETQVTGILDARISGSGDMNIYAGTVGHEELQISGSGTMTFVGVQATTADTHISGSGDIRLKVSQTLDAHISGSGSVFYSGTPQVITQISGSGKVRPI
ncbi:MAG: hypothetical protein B7Z54_04535 [Sphingobacteriales bacterium 12-47-4]|nr:MAG: hypothetical protein B7Z54_04535 [Sphingobacteriales bacterium 12-47-4]